MKKTIQSLEKFISEEVRTSGRTGGVIGVSGGIDSAVCLALTAGAVGIDNTYAFFMPHRKEHTELEQPVRKLCKNIGLELKIQDLSVFISSFKEITGCDNDLQVGNFAARLRMAMLYQYSAEKNALVINTSNRSEYLMGYCTKWGDQAGDISPIAHLYKAEVYNIARELDIPADIINAAPSAGFFTGQEDEEELGISYEDLDHVLRLIDSNNENEADQSLLFKVKKLISASEHKRCLPKSPG